jgi:KRAB domain-containing zinc finger protein
MHARLHTFSHDSFQVASDFDQNLENVGEGGTGKTSSIEERVKNALAKTEVKEDLCLDLSLASSDSHRAKRRKQVPRRLGKDKQALKKHSCNVCEATFDRYREMRSHQRSHKGERDHVCDECGNAYTQAGHLKTHKLSHTGLKNFECDVCHKGFTRNSHLKVHKLTHSEKKDHMCELCSKAFSEAGTLRRHMLTHTRQKDHQCDLCHKTFGLAQSLRRHKLKHFEDDPEMDLPVANDWTMHTLDSGKQEFVCGVCSKEFSSVTSLKTHMFLHTGQQDHRCVLCGKTFLEARALKTHMLLIHKEEKRLVCDLCSKSFAYESYLTRHKVHCGKA